MSPVTLGELWLTELDHARLVKLTGGHPPAVLLDLLESAELSPSPEIPADIVTVHSQVRVLEEGTGERRTLTLCYPDEVDPRTGFISVLSPVGMALLGRRVGWRVTWKTPAGQERAQTIEAILFQPEAAGDFTS